MNSKPPLLERKSLGSHYGAVQRLSGSSGVGHSSRTATNRSHDSYFRLRRRSVSQDLGAVRAGDFKVIDFTNAPKRASVVEIEQKQPHGRNFWVYYIILLLVGIGGVYRSCFR
uniref:Uncharacterized protein n=1 Tax=Rhodosorus marinus TaxID=101924 RepID=A0A7S2ZXT9_9RHOD